MMFMYVGAMPINDFWSKRRLLDFILYSTESYWSVSMVYKVQVYKVRVFKVRIELILTSEFFV